MAKDIKSTYNEQRYFDIVPPNRNMPQSTSRPVIVSNHPEQSDPMVKSPSTDTEAENIENDAETLPVEDKLPADIAIDSETDQPEVINESNPVDKDQPADITKQATEPEKQLTEDLLPKIDPDEPLLPAHASPDIPTVTVNIPQPTSKNHKWLWLVVIIVILLIAIIAGVSYILLS